MIKFDNYIYVREHEKQPRGLGHWAFIVRINNDKLTALNCPFEHYLYNNHAFSLIWASKVMTLTEAKNELRKWLNEQGINKVEAYVAD